MPNLHELKNARPVAPLKLVVLNSASDLGSKVNKYLIKFRKKMNNVYNNDPAFQGYSEPNYLLNFSTPRFNSGEGKAVLNETVRGKDLFIMVDVCNHSLTYKMNGVVSPSGREVPKKLTGSWWALVKPTGTMICPARTLIDR